MCRGEIVELGGCFPAGEILEPRKISLVYFIKIKKKQINYSINIRGLTIYVVLLMSISRQRMTNDQGYIYSKFTYLLT